MSTRDPRVVVDNNWGARAVDHVLYPIALFAAPAFLVVLTVYFVAQAFSRSAGDGVRSFAAVLMPLMVLALLVAFKRSSLRRAAAVPNLWVFVATLGIGLAVMTLLKFTPTSVPVPELVISASFSILIFSRVALGRDKMMFYYFGMVLGFLTYVIVLGFPTMP
jgi:hypothetical protein